jgi:hypothetical protein
MIAGNPVEIPSSLRRYDYTNLLGGIIEFYRKYINCSSVYKAQKEVGITTFGIHGKKSSVSLPAPKREADHSPASSAEVKNEWNYTSTFTYVFRACKAKGKFIPVFN